MYKGIDKDAQYLVDLTFGAVYQKLFFTAIKMDVFSKLQSPCSAGDFAKTMDWHSENTEHFLNTLTGMELLIKDGERYQNTPGSQKYLVKDSEYYLGDFMLIYVTMADFDEESLAELIRKGPQAAQEETVSNVSFADMIDSMRKAQSGARCAEAKRILADLPEFESAKKLLDLGCATGMIGITAAKANPDLEVALFDTPQMAAGMEETIAANNMADRVTAMAGDYLTNDIGSGYDIILAFATLNFAKPAMNEIMGKLYEALNDGGVLLIAGDSIDADGTSPVVMVAGWLPYTLKGMDFRMPSGLIPDTALAQDFRSVRTVTFPAYSGTTELNIIRK